MFIERSGARIRRTRTTFLVAGMLPLVALVGWAVWQRSAGHREAVRGRWQQALGLNLAIDRLEHPRPGVTRACGVTVVAAGGGRVAEIPVVEVESGAGEDRVRLDAVRLDAATVRVIVELGREWLSRDARHPRNCVIDVADLSWPGREAAGRVRIECVAHAGTRAVRASRVDRDQDLVRVVRHLGSAAEDGGDAGAERLDVEAAFDEPLPIDVAMALVGGGTAVFGTAATVRGRCVANCDERGWAGSASGRIERVDLARCVAPLAAAAAGDVTIDVERLAWADGRLVEGLATCRIGAGWIDAAFFDRLALALGCRPAVAADPGANRRFDTVGCRLEVVGGQVAVAALPGSPLGLALVDGTTLLQPPAAPVPFERLAWVLSPPTADFVPAGGAGAWLMSIRPGAAAPRDALLPGTGSAVRDRGGF